MSIARNPKGQLGRLFRYRLTFLTPRQKTLAHTVFLWAYDSDDAREKFHAAYAGEEFVTRFVVREDLP